MDKHLVALVWGLPASFALPSIAACRRALACVRQTTVRPVLPRWVEAR